MINLINLKKANSLGIWLKIIDTIDKISTETFNEIYELLLKNEEFINYYDSNYFSTKQGTKPRKRTLLKQEKDYK